MVDPSGNYKVCRRSIRTIRIPVHMIETINKLNRIQRKLLQENGKEATPEELAEHEMPEDKVKGLKIAKNQFRWNHLLEMMKIPT